MVAPVFQEIMIDLTKSVVIKGYMMETELEWLAQTAKDKKCIIEIGTYYGRSARAMADNMTEDCKLYCIDPYPGIVFYEAGNVAISSGSYVYRQAQKNLQDHIEAGRVIFHRGTVLDFPYELEPDFIFIDGDHCPEAFLVDLEWSIGTMPSRESGIGILAGHDYENLGWPGVKKIVDEHFPTIGRKDYIWWIRK